MKIKGFKSILILVSLFLSAALFGQDNADDILGKWLNEEEDGKVEIYKEGDKYFGKLVWLKRPNNDDGTPRLDIENPEEDLKSRPLDGLVLLTDFVYDDGEWEDGKIYDPKSGNTYSCYMKFDSEDVLKIKGYIGVKWIGRTTYWTRTD
jgi:uncharacterized protein (DUF2147 family)